MFYMRSNFFPLSFYDLGEGCDSWPRLLILGITRLVESKVDGPEGMQLSGILFALFLTLQSRSLSSTFQKSSALGAGWGPRGSPNYAHGGKQKGVKKKLPWRANYHSVVGLCV